MIADWLLRPDTAAGLALVTLAILLLTRRGWRCRPGAERGARILARAPRGRRTAIGLAGVAITPLDELKHFKLIGTTGTGKSTAIRQLVTAALARGDRLIIADPDGGYQRSFFSRFRGDVLLNPYDPHSMSWDLFGEIETSYDVEQLAGALIPNSEDPASREWRGYGRTFLAAALRHCTRHRLTVQDLWRLLMRAGHEELRSVVQGTAAEPFLEADNSRMFTSIRSVVGSALAALEHLQSQRTRPLSVRGWVREASACRVLFIPYRASQIAALRSLIAAWLRLAIFEAMSQADGHDQRLWLVVDELDALGAIDGLKDALARLRKFGCRCVLGFQSIGQITSTYGADGNTIVENCGNTLLLRCSSSENGGTAAFASKLIGERQLVRRQRSRGSEGGWFGGSRRSRSVTEQVVTEPAVLPSEIEQLPDLCGYFKAASSGSWINVRLGDTYAHRT